MKRVKVTYSPALGEDEYGSTDPGDEVAPGLGRSIVLRAGEAAYVSEQKAAQLAEDRPDDFEFRDAVEISDEEFLEYVGQGVPLAEASDPPTSEELEATPAAAADLEPVTESRPQPDLEPVTESRPQPDLEPEPEPKPKPKPKPRRRKQP